MSTYEKIATILIVILAIPMIIFSYREIKEPNENSGTMQSPPAFNESIGQDFKIGPYTTIVGQQSSGGIEGNCVQLQAVVVGALHDIKERLERQKAWEGAEDAFEVNASTLQLFCHKNATITLADTNGNKLLLLKLPFARIIPPQGGADDVGTEVHIDATVLPVGAAIPAHPTTYGDVLIPDRFLDNAASSSGAQQ